jgi:hypothetical protein
MRIALRLAGWCASFRDIRRLDPSLTGLGIRRARRPTTREGEDKGEDKEEGLPTFSKDLE